MAKIDGIISEKEWQDLELKLIEWRRHIHRHPEIAEHEFGTVEYVCGLLSGMGIEHYTLLGGTAVCALIKGGKTGGGSGALGPVVGIRADMDALPISECTGLPYASENAGVMHACGHDMHTAILLGIAKMLQVHRADLSGSVKLFFQPAEEAYGGADRMIKAGVLEDPHVDYCLGLHVAPAVETGKISLKYGVVYAATASLGITVKGRGAHGAKPDHGVDAIIVAAKIVDNLQVIISRMTSPLRPAVLTIGMIHGGTVRNQIADRVVLEGTMRNVDESARDDMSARVRRIAEHTAEAYGAEAEVDIINSYINLRNDDGVTRLVEKSAADVLGEENVEIEEDMGMGGEDFAYFAKARPSCFMHLGCKSKEPGAVNEIHNACFAPDEACMLKGVKVQINNVLELMKC